MTQQTIIERQGTPMSEHGFILSCESTVDLPYSYVSERDISVLFYSYVVDGIEYVDDMGRDPEALPRFYAFLEEGKLPQTSQINQFRYTEYFEELLKRGDVLHIAFGSGMTPSVKNAVKAAAELHEKYPERNIIVVDSMCSSTGYGLLVDTAADMRDAGASMSEINSFIIENRKRLHHQFFSVDLTHYKRSGRMSGPVATIASILGICPIMRLNSAGRIIAYSKVRGKKNAVRKTVDEMLEHADGGSEYAGKCFICNSNCIDDALSTKAALLDAFPNLHEDDIRVFDVGTIIASHCGPGTVAVFFFGDERPE